MSEKQDWFWSGNSLMNNLPDRFASEHVLVLRDDITPPSDEHKALIASAPSMAATIATQAAQIEALLSGINEAREHYYNGEYQWCCDTLSVLLEKHAALSNTGNK